jgi:purine-binding chemotaxis protein CheW
MQTATISPACQPAVPPDLDQRAGKYLVFNLGTEEFGTEVLKVREIMGIQDITTVPQVPPYVKGIINLRGKVIPVIDPRLKFALPPEDDTARTCIIVVRTRQGEEDLMIGMIVDGVVEVLNLLAADIEDAPDFGPGVVTPYLKGMARIKGKVKILLDIDQVLSTNEPHGLTALLQYAARRSVRHAHLCITARPAAPAIASSRPQTKRGPCLNSL